MASNQKKYGDEILAELMNQHKKGIKGSCKEGLYVREDLFHCKKFYLYEDVFSIYIPLRFQQQTDEEQEKEFGYPIADYRFYYKSKDMSIHITSMEKDENHSLIELMRMAKKEFERQNPDMVCMEITQWKQGNVEFIEMEATKTTRYDKKYQFFCMFTIENKIYQFIYDASARYMYPWREAVHEILKTVEIEERG